MRAQLGIIYLFQVRHELVFGAEVDVLFRYLLLLGEVYWAEQNRVEAGDHLLVDHFVLRVVVLRVASVCVRRGALLKRRVDLTAGDLHLANLLLSTMLGKSLN